MSSIAEQLAQVRGRIAEAACRAGRAPDAITLVAVSKTRTVDEVRQALAAGAVHLGENYVQEMTEKQQALGGGPDEPPLWHAIGHLQRNKIKYLIGYCHLIHSVDSARLAEEIDRRAQQAGRVQPVLIEVNIAGEDSKFGVSPENVQALAEHAAGLSHLRLQGLMAMTPYGVEADQSRRYFGAAYELAQRVGANLPEGAMATLSMGMTQDFEVAVEQGATHVRVGTAIFGQRRRD